MPSSYLKTILSVVAALIVIFGVAGMLTSHGTSTQIAQMGAGKGAPDPVEQQPPEMAALDQPVEVQHSLPKKYAVIVGVVYDNAELGQVSFADKDAESMYYLLVNKLGFPRENVVMLTNSQATHDAIFTALGSLANNPDIDAGADVVFFYSGHGLRSQPNIGLNIPNLPNSYALVPFDFMRYDYKKGQGLVWDSELASYLSKINAGRMWINIDSCFSGGFIKPGITGPNRVVTTSSRADELSSEIPEVQRGVMVDYMIEEGIAKGLSVEAAFGAAAPKASQNFGQNPQIADEYAGNMDLGSSPWGRS